jgi:heme exporter protein C
MYASPAKFYQLAGTLIPWFAVPAAILLGVGLYLGFIVAPTDFRQGEAYRIIYIHVPAAWMSMWLYLCMAAYAALGLIFKTRLSSMMAGALAPTGALFTLIALWSGSLWGRPMWGTWWEWDPRLTSELVLLFLYLGVMALAAAIDDTRKADRATGLLALVGVVNIPIIYYSVQWWNSLHQGPSISVSKGSSMDSTMLSAMLIMTAAVWLYSFVPVFMRVRCIILERERHTGWVQALLKEEL